MISNSKLCLLLLFLSFNLSASISSDAPWESTGKKDGIDLFRKEIPGSDIIALKGIGVVEQPLWKVAASLLDTTNAPEWVDSLEESSVIKRIDRHHYIEYNHIGTPFFMEDRDFVSLVKIIVDPTNKTFTLAYLPSDESAPEHGYIQGEINPGLFKLTALDQNRTLLQGEIHCDPKGSIAKWLVNYFQSDWAHETILALREHTANDVHIPAEFSDVLRPTLNW